MPETFKAPSPLRVGVLEPRSGSPGLAEALACDAAIAVHSLASAEAAVEAESSGSIDVLVVDASWSSGSIFERGASR